MIKWLIITSFAGSIASLALILLKAKLTETYGGRWYYRVCLCALLLFVLPLQINVPVLHPQFALLGERLAPGPSPSASETVAKPEQKAIEQTAPAATMLEDKGFPVLSMDQWILAVWVCGFVVMLCRYCFAYFRFKQKALQAIVVDKVENLNVEVSSYVHSPMLIGFVRPVIVFPYTQISQEDYELAIRHELIHYRQKDAWCKLFAVIVNCVHWFNPVAYLALANIGEACEFSVDETMTKNMRTAEKQRYSEMILQFASRTSPALNSSLAQRKKQLYRRFALIMNPNTGRGRAFPGFMLAGLITAVAIFSSSVVFAKAPEPLAEYSGGMKTYYNPFRTLEQNVQDTLGIANAKDKTLVTVRFGDLYIDAEGRKIDSFNRTQPYYRVAIRWKEKGPSAGMTTKTLSINGKIVTVAFANSAVAYKDDPVIEKMVRNQIAFELGYQPEKDRFTYDHQVFINELIKRGAYVIEEVVPPKAFTYDKRKKQNGGIAGLKPLTAYDKKEKIADIFHGSVKLPQSIEGSDGREGQQLGDTFVIKSGETLAVNFKEAADSMPTISLAVIDETTGKLMDWYPAVSSGYRYIYTPGQNDANHSFKVVASGEKEDTAKIEIFTYKTGPEEMTP